MVFGEVCVGELEARRRCVAGRGAGAVSVAMRARECGGLWKSSLLLSAGVYCVCGGSEGRLAEHAATGMRIAKERTLHPKRRHSGVPSEPRSALWQLAADHAESVLFSLPPTRIEHRTTSPVAVCLPQSVACIPPIFLPHTPSVSRKHRRQTRHATSFHAAALTCDSPAKSQTPAK